MAMNNGERLLHTLEQYFALKQHQPNAAFQQRLAALQTWQIKRLFHTHQQRLATQEAHATAHFLFYEVYGGANLPQVAHNIQRATKKAMALLPSTVMHTAAVTLEAAVLTQQLDEALVQVLPEGDIQPQTYAQAYRASSTPEQRQQQFTLIEEAAQRIDRYIRRRWLMHSFRVMRRPAYAAKLNALYDLLHHGFQALSGLNSMSPLIASLVHVEKEISERLFQAHPNPFDGVTP